MVRVATFNLNNLFSRWSFQADLPEQARIAGARTDPEMPVLHADAPSTLTDVPAAAAAAAAPSPQVVDVTLADGTVLTGVLRTYLGRLVKGKNPKDRAWIAARIKAMDVDVVCAQEVEDQDALDAFHREDLAPIGRTLVEGNDPRRIDVAVMFRIPLGRVSSWRFWPDPDQPGQPVFSRDLLQVEVLAGGRPLQAFINHLKSNFIPDEFTLGDAERTAARAQILARRRCPAEAVADILDRQRLSGRVVVLGDMNDDPDSNALFPLRRSGPGRTGRRGHSAARTETQRRDGRRHVRGARRGPPVPATSRRAPRGLRRHPRPAPAAKQRG